MAESAANAQQGTKVKVLWDFEASEDDELKIEENDIIVLTGMSDGDWWEGELNGNVGWFPSNYVEIATGDDDGQYADISQSGVLSKEEDDQAISAEKNRAWYSLYKSKPKKEKEAKKEEPAPEQPKDKDSSRIMSRVIINSPLATGKWSDDIDGMILGRLSDKEKRRQEIIFELLQTERDYVRDLDIIIELFLNGLRDSKILSAKDITTMFSNIESLLPINQELLRTIEERRDTYQVVMNIGDIFIRVSDYFKMYNMYCSNHPYAVNKMETIKSKAFLKFINEQRSKPECRNLDLGSFLIKPVQRICKYPLLLRELIKYTDENHDDRPYLDEAFKKVEMVVAIVNEASRQADEAQKMLSLQNKFSEKVEIIAPSRQMVRDLPVTLVVDNKEKDRRHLYLFTDVLILAKVGKSANDKYQLIAYISLDTLLVTPVEGLGIELTHHGVGKHVIRVADLQVKGNLVEELQRLAHDEAARKEQERLYAEEDEHLEVMDEDADGVAEPMSAEELAAKGKIGKLSRIDAIIADDRGSSPISSSGSRSSLDVTPKVTQTPPTPTTPTSQTQPPKFEQPAAAAPPAASAAPVAAAANVPKKSSSAFLSEQERSASQMNEFQNISSNLRRAPAAGADKSSSAEAAAQLNNIKSNLRQSKALEETPRKSSAPVDEEELPEFRRVKLRQTRVIEESKPGNNGPISRGSDVPTSPPPQATNNGGGGGGGGCCGGGRREAPPSTKPNELVTQQPSGTESITRNDAATTTTTTTASTTSAGGKNTTSTSANRVSAVPPGKPNPGGASSSNLPKPLRSSVASPALPILRAAVKEHRRLDAKKNDAFVYIVEVVREDNVVYYLQKSYDDFYGLHAALMTQFREEAGFSSKPKTLPDLPSQPFNVSESMASVLTKGLDRYIKTIFRLPEKITKSLLVLNFLKNDPRQTVHVVKAAPGAAGAAAKTGAGAGAGAGAAPARAAPAAAAPTSASPAKTTTPASSAPSRLAPVSKQPAPVQMVAQQRDAPQDYSGPVKGNVSRLASGSNASLQSNSSGSSSPPMNRASIVAQTATKFGQVNRFTAANAPDGSRYKEEKQKPQLPQARPFRGSK